MTGGAAQLLSNLVDVRRSYGPVIINHYNVAPVFDIYSNVDRTDLGSVGAAVQKIVEKERANLPRGTTLTLRGEYETMRTSFVRLGLGILFAIVLVYLLMAVNFQSWVDSLIILTALPGAMAGILWMLFVTGTTLSVPSLVGSIMSIGVATANSILLVTFANDERAMIPDARAAMLSAGFARIRPVLMTAAAMILGMLPMALALGEGGEQNAPAGPRGYRRPARRDRDDAVRRADHLFVSAAASAGESGEGAAAGRSRRIRDWTRSVALALSVVVVVQAFRPAVD